MSWRYTSDPSAPCSLCVAWVDDTRDGPRPVGLKNVTLERLYRGIHTDCQRQAVA